MDLLKSLRIQNLAVIQDLTITFPPHFSVITGSSGAGKSLLLTAIHLALGGKALPSLIRPHCTEATITLTLQQAKEERIIQRTLSIQGASVFSYNHKKCSRAFIKTLADTLFESHSQHQALRLKQESEQRYLLDLFGQHQDLCEKVAQAYDILQKTQQALATLQAPHPTEEALLSYQYEELHAFQAKDHEYTELFTLNKNWHHIQDHQQHIEQSQHHLEQAVSSVCDAKKMIRALPPSTWQKNLMQGLEESHIILQDSIHSILHLPEEEEAANHAESRATLTARLDDYTRLAHKYKCAPEALSTFYADLKKRIEIIQTNHQQKKNLEKQWQDNQQHYHICAQALHQARQKAAIAFEKALLKHKSDVGFYSLFFKIVVDYQKDCIHHDGSDKITWLFSSNPGHPLEALSQIASGGELSRISLIATLLTAQLRTVPILILDEIDAGLGGDLAASLGKMLRLLGQHNQILCITHAASLAQQANQHLMLQKQISQEKTYSSATWLNADQRLTEEQRLTGLPLTEKA
jgi:DNA repair protein RecN (Recombination protein N)